MIVSDTHNFASRISRDMSSIQEERLEYTEKLSSGKKHVRPFDDAGALSMEMKNESELKRMRQVSQTLQNGLSYTHAQQAALQIVQGIYRRMSTLATMAQDVTKTDSDRELYDREFQELREQVLEIDMEQFNGQDLFRNTRYKVMDTGNITWTNARAHAAASSKSDPQYDHYMATVTTADEQDEINRQLEGQLTNIALWLGGSDAHTEGEWRWVEGPEAKEEGGLGKLFWNGKSDNHTPAGYVVNGAYENWNANEPNDFRGNEDALQILSHNALWNDLPHETSTNPRGYIRESDPVNLRVQSDEHGQEFELQRVNFKRFLPSTEIDLKTMANAQDALGRIMEAEEDVSDKLALVGASAARFRSEFESMDEQMVEKEKTLSRIADLDMAVAASRLARLEVRMQATTSVFVQANRIFDQRNYVEELLL